MRITGVAALSVLAVALTGCGGSQEAEPPVVTGAVVTKEEAGGPALPGWVESLLHEREGSDVGLVMGSSDFGVGPNRLTFLVVRGDGELVQAPTATVYAGSPDAKEPPVRTEATLVPLGPHSHSSAVASHDHTDITDIYVAHVDLPEAGRQWLVVDPAGEEIQGVGAIDVRPRTLSPPVGDKAPASDTPTLADAPAEELTTASPPDVELLRYSITDSLEAHVPFVAVFATPAFCVSRTCGPTVEVVEKVRRTFADSDIRFIHVEIFADNNPKNGFNRWVREWNLPTEPWVFLVDGQGVIRAKFEGSVSVGELEASVREHLHPGS